MDAIGDLAQLDEDVSPPVKGNRKKEEKSIDQSGRPDAVYLCNEITNANHKNIVRLVFNYFKKKGPAFGNEVFQTEYASLAESYVGAAKSGKKSGAEKSGKVMPVDFQQFINLRNGVNYCAVETFKAAWTDGHNVYNNEIDSLVHELSGKSTEFYCCIPNLLFRISPPQSCQFQEIRHSPEVATTLQLYL